MSARDIFGAEAAKNETTYRVVLRFKHLVVGGIPSDRSVIEAWLRARMELGDASLSELVSQTVAERGVLTPDEAIDAVLASDLAPSVNGFKRNENGELCLESRIIKAGLKEWANSSYPGTDWPGKAKYLINKKGDASLVKKGLMKYLEEAVTIEGVFIGLGVKEPLEVQERIKHVMTPQGPRSTINRVEVVYQPEITFTMRVRDDFLPDEAWARIWVVGEGIGLGSDRGRSDGQFTLESWKRV
jgi:hypothetical protein